MGTFNKNALAKVTKPKLITYENIEQKYRLKTMDLEIE